MNERTLESLTTVELKAIAYDAYVNLQNLQQTLDVVQKEILNREKEKTPDPDSNSVN